MSPMMNLIAPSIAAVERGLVPDFITRAAIRRLCETRLRVSGAEQLSHTPAYENYLESLRSGPVALLPERANDQHYELPPQFFNAVLGPRKKYSCCYFPHPNTSLADAEVAALEVTCARAELADGQHVLELGCGWGSLSLWMATHYPNSHIVAVSNSAPQRRSIEAEASRLRLDNLTVITADVNSFTPGPLKFDRVVSVEMFEHMRNYEELLARISAWLEPAGKLFVHIFCHRELSYPFETKGESDWMARYFFTGGMMPSSDLLCQFNRDLQVTQHNVWNGQHYQRTAEAWLQNMDQRKEQVLGILAQVYGRQHARRWFGRWRMFFMAVAELFGYEGGTEWYVSHYLLERA